MLLQRLSERGQGSLTPKDVDALGHKRGVVDLPFSGLPMLVRFRDIHDPTTIEQVDPNSLDVAFGPGVKLLSASLAVTDDPPTNGIDKTLNWLRSLNGGYLDGRHISGSGPLGDINVGNFKTGEP